MSPANPRRAVAGATLGLASAMALGFYLPLPPALGDGALGLALHLLLGLAPVAAALAWTHRMPLREVPAELGLDRGALAGLGQALLITAPMLAGFLLARRGVFFEEGGTERIAAQPWRFLSAWAGAGLVEETLFRGYLYRQLVRRAGWPSARAMVTCGLLFGLLHVPAAWGHPAAEIAGSVLITAVGGAAFCWLLERWSWNLWFLVGWHAFVNLWWILGRGGDSAVGGPLANLLRAGVIVLTFAVASRKRPQPSPVAAG